MDENLKLILEAMNKGFQGINQRLDGLKNRMSGVEGRLDRLETRMDSLEKELHDSVDELKSMDNAILSEVERVHEIIYEHVQDKTRHTA